jgi:hypothetical protein
MAIGILGLMALGLGGTIGGGWGANKLSKHFQGQDDYLYNKDDNITGADANVNKQSNGSKPVIQNDAGELDADGGAPGTSSLITTDIEGDPDGGSLLDAATIDDNAIVQGAKDSVEPYTDPVSGMQFNNHNDYLDYVDKYPAIYRWKSNRPMRRIFKGETSPQQQYDIKEKLEFAQTKFKDTQKQKKTIKESELEAKIAQQKADRWSKAGEGLMQLGASQMNPYVYKNINE